MRGGWGEEFEIVGDQVSRRGIYLASMRRPQGSLGARIHVQGDDASPSLNNQHEEPDISPTRWIG